MQHFPIFLSLVDQDVVVSGGGEAALAKLRLLAKTEARVRIFVENSSAELRLYAARHQMTVTPRALQTGDVTGAALCYAANEDAGEDARTAAIARAEGALVNIVDNLADSAFITPAIVDRDPVTIAIGTEGAAPVLARAIKRDLEDRLPTQLGLLARIGKTFRPMVEKLPFGRPRRDFWSDFYFNSGPRAASHGKDAIQQALQSTLTDHIQRGPQQGHVDFVGAGPGDPELLTLKARHALDKADVILHDRLIAPEILELARREAVLIETGKTGFGAAMPQEDINALMVDHASKGAQVVRLKSGDPTIFGRLDEEIAALEAADLPYRIIPGITAASAAVADIGQSLTRRGRNGSLRLLTGHDMKGFADHDWRALAAPGDVAAIYMGKRASRFIQGRLLMHGADPATPISIVENASRPDQRVIASSIATLAQDIAAAELTGPAISLLGLSPRAAQTLAPQQGVAL